MSSFLFVFYCSFYCCSCLFVVFFYGLTGFYLFLIVWFIICYVSDLLCSVFCFLLFLLMVCLVSYALAIVFWLICNVLFFEVCWFFWNIYGFLQVFLFFRFFQIRCLDFCCFLHAFLVSCCVFYVICLVSDKLLIVSRIIVVDFRICMVFYRMCSFLLSSLLFSIKFYCFYKLFHCFRYENLFLLLVFVYCFVFAFHLFVKYYLVVL